MRPHAPFAAILAVALAPAQATHIVGPSGHAEIRDAIAVASAGDRILIEPGTYGQFAVDKSLTIRAVTDGTVHIALDPSVVDPPGTSITLTAGEIVHLAGLVFEPRYYVLGLITLHSSVRVTGGDVTLENCSITSPSPLSVLSANGTRLHLVDCQFTGTSVYPGGNTQGGAAGLRSINSEITAVNCSFQASPWLVQTADSPAGIELQHTDLHASNITVVGGGISWNAHPGPGIRADATSRLWLSDSSSQGGTNGSVTACGIDAPASVGHLARCTIGPTLCPMPPNGPLVGASRVQAPQVGAPFAIDYTTQAGAWIAVRVTTQLAPRAFSFCEQPWWADDQALGVGFFLVGPTGSVRPQWQIPNDPWFRDLVVWFHGIELSLTLPLQVAPPVGGLIR